MIKVLVVEDEQFLRKGLVLSTPWEQYGCQVVGEAGNAMEAMELAKRLRPDIVITDIRMPQMTGLEMIRQMQAAGLGCQFIIVSGFNDFAYAKQALEYGVKGYLVKPIDDDELDEVLRRTVDAVRQHRHYRQVEELEQSAPGKSAFWMEEDLSAFDSKEQYITAAVRYIQAHLHEEIAVKDVADALGISDSYLSKLLRQKTGYTFLKLLTEIRIRRALELMRDESLKVYEVAERTGYRDARYFSEIFKKLVGVTPSEYRGGEKAVK